MERERRFFSDEFKREAVKLVRQPGASKAAIARDLGVGPNLLGRWVRDEEGTAASIPRSSKGDGISVQEFERMRRELAKVKTERDILKKALGYFAADPK
jgi:transposase